MFHLLHNKKTYWKYMCFIKRMFLFLSLSFILKIEFEIKPIIDFPISHKQIIISKAPPLLVNLHVAVSQSSLFYFCFAQKMIFL